MSNAWLSGSIARSITAQKRSRLFWNLFFSVPLILVIFLICMFVSQILNDYRILIVEQTYDKYENGYLYTDEEEFLIFSESNQEIKNNILTERLQKGDRIQLTISAISRELLTVQFDGEVLYQANITSTTDIVVISLFFCVSLSFIIFFFVVINIKTSNKKIRKIQRQLF